MPVPGHDLFIFLKLLFYTIFQALKSVHIKMTS